MSIANESRSVSAAVTRQGSISMVDRQVLANPDSANEDSVGATAAQERARIKTLRLRSIFERSDDTSAGSMHLSTYFKRTHARLTDLRCTRMTLDQLIGRLGCVKNDPRFPSFTDHVGQRALHAEKVALELGLKTSDFPPLVFEPGHVVEAVEDLIEHLEAELARSKSDQMKEMAIPICEAFVLGKCPNGVICKQSHAQESVRGWIERWLRRNTFADVASPKAQQQQPLSATPSPTNVSAASVLATSSPHSLGSTMTRASGCVLTTAAHPLGMEAWAVVVDIIRSGAWLETRPPVTKIVARMAGKLTLNVINPALAHNWIPSLTSLDLSKNNLGEVHPKSVLKLATALPTNSTLTELNLSYNVLGLGGVMAILNAIVPPDASPTTPKHRPAETPAADFCCRITALNVSNNNVSSMDPAYPHFCAAVARAAGYLSKLALGGNSLGSDGARKLMRSLTERHPLGLMASPAGSPSSLGDRHDAAAFSASDNKLFGLGSDDNTVGLTYLDLSANRLGDQGFSVVADFLKHCELGRQLKFLDLSWNRASVDGVSLLCGAITESAASKPGGAVGSGAPSTATAMTVNSLSSELAAASITANTLVATASPTLTNQTGGTSSPKSTRGCCIQAIKLQYNPFIGKKGALSLSQFLKSNTTVTHLDLRWTGVGDEGAASLAEALISNKSILEMPLGGNDVDPRVEDAFQSRLRKRADRGLPSGVISMSSCVW